MKHLLLFASLLSPAPLLAQSIHPQVFGSRFCELRRLGVSATQARDIAIDESLLRNRKPVLVDWYGIKVNSDILAARHYVKEHCPGLDT